MRSRHFQERPDPPVLVLVAQPHEARSQTLLPGDQLHLLEGAASVQIGPLGVLHGDGDGHRRVGHKRPLAAIVPSSRSVSLFLTTMKCHGWLFRELGAHRPALRSLSTTGPGTGSGL